MHRAQIAQETVKILEQGQYRTLHRKVVSIEAEQQACVANTAYYEPDTLTTIRNDVLATPAPFDETIFEIANETTLQGAARITATSSPQRIGVLNFASAKNPGGGFLKGASAQEESLARSSGLYQSLLQGRAYYDFHRAQKTCLYSDRMIYSPGCPVFRDDQGNFFDEPYLVDFITSAAPNAGAIQYNEPESIPQIPEVFNERVTKMLGLAAYNKCDTLVLGAWGCGVFANDPLMVAEIFWRHLGPQGAFWGRFERVVFSVLDKAKDQQRYSAFDHYFAQQSTAM
ncbi:MAG: TIGR02452 family protein [Chloroflexi bacterium AL-W]|nr:TIGR02452 family protein [Chloroflexi bacterium AL-N1]NOK67035.1 TIGR02452 family protein [Chloroflexi bacterium AL-N10]NOK74673.1 TIGR02452 family protein [Chloroflexi bacterium AL-N5]NOK81637.1 TIGR02452 family protein [Chloroflexi bacterium AL-W]NOK89107.1 TIGR02452 family protein [Chloroflexi bacterium AL-N15]